MSPAFLAGSRRLGSVGVAVVGITGRRFTSSGFEDLLFEAGPAHACCSGLDRKVFGYALRVDLSLCGQ